MDFTNNIIIYIFWKLKAINFDLREDEKSETIDDVSGDEGD